MRSQTEPWPGFSRISDRIFLRNSVDTAGIPSKNEPTTIIIFGWGDGLPKHVSKYADGYHELFPTARILVVLSRTLQASNQPLESRIQAMMPIIDLFFPTPPGSDNKEEGEEEEERILLHAMSNTGAIFAAATIVAYQQRHGADKLFPHKLLVCDSTPGGLDFSKQVGRWSRAMAVGTGQSFPWPLVVTQGLWYAFLWTNWAWERLWGSEPAGVWATRIMNDVSVTSRDALRLYTYSKEDEIIWWEDLEKQAAESKSLGYMIDLEMFQGSPHVGHMRLHSRQYWHKISTSWEMAQDIKGCQ